MASIDLKKILENMPNLPSMPHIVSEALSIIENPKSSINQLSAVISKDISITTQILKIVNSSYYGFPSQITTINKAMALLGFSKVKSLILSAALKPMMMSHSGKSLWEHSLRCAVGCQLMAKSLGKGETDEAFVVGLLHDIGKNVLEIYDKDVAREIPKLIKSGSDRLKIEKNLFGFNHAEIGGQLVRKWNLPVIIENCVRYHHNPQDSDDISTVGVVYIANMVTQEQSGYPVLDPDIINLFDFEVPDPMKLREEIFVTAKSIIDALSR